MLTDELKASLEEAWGPARRAGVLGSASIETLVEHTAGFAHAVCSSFSADFESFSGRVVDVGTGAGVPGVLLACLLPGAEFTLIDASERRLDHVRRAARAAGVADRVDVVHGRGDALARLPAYREQFDVALARLLADPAEALEQLVPLVRDAGVVVVATAEDHIPRWESLPVPSLPTSAVRWQLGDSGRYAVVSRLGELRDELPRREKIRQRSPAF